MVLVDSRRAEHCVVHWFPRPLLLSLQLLWDFGLSSLVQTKEACLSWVPLVLWPRFLIGSGNYCLNVLLDFLIAKSSLLVIQRLSDKSHDCSVSFCVCVCPSGLTLDLTLGQEVPL